jgi:hypothetical protein
MRRFLNLVLVFVLLHGVPSVASTQNYRTTRRSTFPHASATRPYYGGGHHTEPHGGKYPGATNAHHKNGHYQNWRTGDSYGVHQAQ